MAIYEPSQHASLPFAGGIRSWRCYLYLHLYLDMGRSAYHLITIPPGSTSPTRSELAKAQTRQQHLPEQLHQDPARRPLLRP
jgi:hypothetical protein